MKLQASASVRVGASRVQSRANARVSAAPLRTKFRNRNASGFSSVASVRSSRSSGFSVRAEAPAGATVAPDVATSMSASSGSFNWKAQWYPVAFINDIDHSVPHPMTLMGEPIVFWKDNDGQWQCVLDRCPHRLAPLSEGRIDEEGRIECGYHGWAFNGKGACESIPQARENVAAAACSSQRACVTAYKTAVRQGMLFVLPMKDAPAVLPPVPELPHLEEPGWVVMDVMRDLPYDYATLLENVMDVSHVPFTHHLTVGNRKNAAPVDLELGQEGVQPNGFTGLWQEGPRRGALGSQFTTFTAPTLMVHRLTSKAFGVTETVVYATPTLPGRCRLLARFPFKFSSPIPMFVIKNTPKWVNHQGQNRVLEDDQIFLHIQERVLEQEMAEGKSLAQACYLPTPADVYVSAFRKWLSMVGGSPAYPAHIQRRLPPQTEPSEALLDRFNSHTKSCVHCMKALNNVRMLKKVAIAAGAAALLLFGGSIVVAALKPAAAGASLASQMMPTISGFVGAVVSALFFGKLKEWEKNFLVGPYPPPRNDLSRKANKRQLVKRPAAAAADNSKN